MNMSVVDQVKSQKSKVSKKSFFEQNVKDHGYNEVPYTSYPFEFARPEKIASVATIFGLTPPPIETARVLELGCASGGNITRFAQTYPKSYTLGVDLSEKQIESGQKIIKDLKLKNIELKAMSLTDLDEKTYGKFDYIISHGVFSWVPDFVRENMLKISNKMLNKNGLSFISYNALPGWNMTNTIRELMLYHSENFDTPQEKVTQSRAVLAFLQESLENQNTPYAKFMQESAKMMAIREDNYIFHDHLEPDNKAFYIREFIEMSKKHKMQYLGDINISSMSIKHMPKKTVEKLKTINDMARTEQYADFIKNTMFKCSLLVHEGAKFSYNIEHESLNKFYYHAKIALDTSNGEVNITDKSTATFYFNNSKDLKISTDHPIAKASMMVLVKNIANPLLIDDVVKEVKKLVADASEAEIKQNIVTNFGELILVNYINYIVEKPKNVNIISKKPKISKFALLQSKQDIGTSGAYHITSAVNTVFSFDDSRLKLIQSLDGTRDVVTLKKEAFERLKSGEITAMQNNQKVEDEKQLKNIADSLVDTTLEQLRAEFCLVA